ncbi:MAG: PTS sugar transporter subunit IIA [Verrucomicrobia bacterium]|nr:PTS sugar transporter subunit IIA [Verrucomicrobiota bacterium]
MDNLRSGIFIHHLNAPAEKDAIEMMLSAVGQDTRIKDLASLKSAIFERQKADPPILSSGIAFPHARTDTVQELLLVIATCEKPIVFGAIPVRLIFLIGVPKTAVREYLELTSFLARNLRTQHEVDTLAGAANLEAFVQGLAIA